MLLKKLIPGLLLLLSLNVEAQISDQSGKVFTTNDTLTGLLNYSFDNIDYLYLSNAEGTKKAIPVYQIKIVKLDNNIQFRTCLINSTAENSQFTTNGKVHMLLKVLIKGKQMALYSKPGALDVLYVSKGDSIYALRNNEIVIKKDEGTLQAKFYKKYDLEYQKVLSKLMLDKPFLLSLLYKTDYNEEDLSNLVIAYNEGEVSYIMPAQSTIKRESQSYLFAQYSQFNSLLGNSFDNGDEVLFGIQYFYRKESRLSIKLSLSYSFYQYTSKNDFTGALFKKEHDFISLGLRTEYDYFKNNYFKAYAGILFCDLGWANLHQSIYSEGMKGGYFYPRFSPYIGFDVNLHKNFSAFAELNHLFGFQNIPRNFTLGLKYKL